MRKSFIFSVLLFAVFSISARASVIYVDSANVAGVKNGFSWTTAFSNLQVAIDSSRAGDSIWVAKGTYQHYFNSSAFAMKDSVKIFGGFRNTHTQFNERDFAANITTIKGNGYIVILNSFLDEVGPEAWLDGFTVTGGIKGGMENSFCSPTVNNCTFINNSYATGTAAMQNTACSSVITNCRFISNTGSVAVMNAGFGAFPPDNEQGPTFINCKFSGNAGTDAGAVRNVGCIVRFSNCDFRNNTSTLNAGAMENTEAVVDISGSMFYNNVAREYGGGIYQTQCSTTITDCRFIANKAEIGGGIRSRADSADRYLDISYCSFDSNKATFTGAPDNPTDLRGGGVYNYGKANIRHCVFNGNYAGYKNNGAVGAGLFTVFYSTVPKPNMVSTISNCQFYNNKAEVDMTFPWWNSNGSGGGASIGYANISDCVFEGNIATLNGGGLIVGGSTPQDGEVNRCKMINNKARRGGGIYGSGEVRIFNSLIAKNTSDSFGGGIHVDVYQNYKPVLVNNTIVSNKSRVGGAVYLYAYAALTATYKMSNNIIWGNSTGVEKLAMVPAPIITYSMVQGMAIDAVNHIIAPAYPVFVDTIANNYALQSTSPCIDMGRNDSMPSILTTDLANHNRIYNTTIDLGAYEYGIFPPQPNLGNDITVCPNTPVTLRVPYQEATTYLWNTGAITKSINVTAPGKYYVTATNTLGSAADTIMVTHLSAPVVNLGNDTATCGSATLDARNPDASYRWSNNATTQKVNVGIGTFWVIVTGNNFCQSSDTINVTQLPLPVVNLGNDTAVAQGTSLTLDAGNPGATYLWNTGATTQTIVATAPGTFSVTVTGSQGCSKSDEIKISITNGITETAGNSGNVTLHPNPAQNRVTVMADDLMPLPAKINVYDVYGRMVHTAVMEKREQLLSLDGFATGIYLIKVGENAVLRLVKQ